MDFSMEKYYSLAGQNAVVTGGASGLGLAITRCLIGAGAKVAVLGRSAEAHAADTLAGKRYMNYDSLMTYLDGQVHLSDSLTKAMTGQVDRNRGRAAQGYRIRIYFDNSQNARTVSEQIVDTFKVHHPDVPVFRIYDNPYFKVTVGEFRTKSDAMRFLEAIRPEYPTVFLVKESFSTI